MLLIPVFTTTVADGDLGIMLDSVCKVSEDGKE
jgi:hypothetical protein